MGMLAALYRIAAGFVRPFKAGDGVRVYGSTSGYVGAVPAAAAGSVDYTLPSSAPAADGYALTCTTGGVMSWAAAGSAAWESVSGDFKPKTSVIADGDRILLRSRETSAAGAEMIRTTCANTLSNRGWLQRWYSDDGTTPQVGLMRRGDIVFDGGDGNWVSPYKKYVGFVDPETGGYEYDYGQTYYADASYFYIQLCPGSHGYHTLFTINRYNANIQYGPFSLGLGYRLAVDCLNDGTTSNAGDSGMQKSAETNGTMKFDYDDVDFLVMSDKTTTTDNTTTTIWNETLEDNQVHMLDIMVVGRRTDTAGRWCGNRRAMVYRAGGGATLEGSVETIGTDITNGIAPTVTIDTSSNDVRVRVTGETGKTINWRVRVSKVHAN